MRQRINLRDAVADICPNPPPCFHNRMSWMEYLQSAAAVQNHKGEPTVVLVQDGQPVFNRQFDFCSDCTQRKAADMKSKGRCVPAFFLHHG